MGSGGPDALKFETMCGEVSRASKGGLVEGNQKRGVGYGSGNKHSFYNNM